MNKTRPSHDQASHRGDPRPHRHSGPFGRLGSHNRSPGRPTLAPLSELTVAVAPSVIHAVVHEHRWLAPALAAALEGRRQNQCPGSRRHLAEFGRALAVVGLDRAAQLADARRNNCSWPRCSIRPK